MGAVSQQVLDFVSQRVQDPRTFYIAASLALAALIGTLARRRYGTGLADIPGPFLASISTIWQIFYICEGHIEEAVHRQHKKHGHFVRISHREVSCTHPDSISLVLNAPVKKGDWYRTFAVPDQKHQTPMSETDPKRHRERSSIVQQAYTYSFLSKHEDKVDVSLNLLRKRLGEEADSAKPTEMDRWFNYFNFDVIGELTYSQHFGFLQKGDDIEGAIKNMRFLMFYTTLIGYMLWLHPILLGSPLISFFNLKPSQHIFRTVKAAVATRKQKGAEAKGDMMELWLKNHAKKPGMMADHEVNAVASSTTIAGSETMTGAMEAVFYYLLKHPAHMKTLLAEIDAAHMDGQLSDIPSYQEISKLPFLQACIKETMRYFPPSPFNLPRIAGPGGITIGGQHFAAGTTLSVNPVAFHRSTEVWGADAELFNPYRWLRPASSPEPPTVARTSPWVFDGSMDRFIATFGGGYNSCPGKTWGYAQIAKVTATLLRDLDFQLVDPGKEWKFRTQFTVVQHGWPVRITRREHFVSSRAVSPELDLS